MKNIKVISLILSLSLLIGAIQFVIFAEDSSAAVAEPEYYTFEDGMGKEEIPYGSKAPLGAWAGYKNFKMMNKTQAEAAGVPEGYSGWVLALDPSGTSSISIGLDFTHIKVADIEKITIRVWCPEGTADNGVRITHNSDNTWIMLGKHGGTGKWVDIELDENKNFNISPYDFTLFDDGNGYCKAVNFWFRYATGTAYIDHIKIELKEGAAGSVEPELGKVEIPFTEENKDLSIYGYSDMRTYDAAGAVVAGVPEGYTGSYVMKLTRDAGEGDLSVMLDLRQSVCNGVKIEDVESITFRVWIPHAMDLRIRSVAGEWLYNTKHTPAEGGAWREITIKSGSAEMSKFVDDGEGYFSPFAFTFRNNYDKTTPCTVYFDGVTVVLKEAEEEPTETEAPTETETTEVETETETEAPVAPDPLYYSFADGKGKEEIPYGEKSSVGAWYGYNNFRMMNEEQAKYAGVPEGYSGWVLALDSSSSGTSIGLDLTNIRVKHITKITFRVWCPTGTKQDSTDGGIRLTGAASNTWSAMISPSAIGEWIDVTLEKDDYSFLDFDGNGYCDPINFCLRGANSTAYIDAITVELKPADANPPVITYEGETVINTTAGKPFVLDASAYDAEDDEYITPEYIWNGDALDADGLLVEGSYTLTVKATDTYGNTSELVLTVNVGPKDTEAPVIGWTPVVEAVYAMKGAKPSIRVSVTDNTDKVEAVLIWSEGALDEAGRLTEGLHTLTISATDLSGNHSEYTVLFCVTASRPTVGNISQDS